MTFVKGQSGNPGGRPKGLASRVRDLVNADEMVNFALRVLNDPGEEMAHRLTAWKLLAERGWGKPHQSVSVEGEITHGMLVMAMTPEQQERRLRELDERRLLVEGAHDPESK